MTNVRIIVGVALALALLSVPRAGRSQTAGAPDRDLSFHFRHLTIDDGLSQSSVLAVRQDGSRFMWFGTQNGLNRYDGYSVRVYRYDSADPASISDNYVRSLFEDSQRRLWVGTDRGLNRYDRTRDGFERYLHDPDDEGSLPGHAVRHIAQDSAGALWVGTADGGLGRFDEATGRFTPFRHDPSDGASLGSNAVRRMLRLPDGFLLVATDRGLDLFDPGTGKFGHYRHDPGITTTLTGDDVTALVQDSPGRVWVGTTTGLNLLDIRTGRAIRFVSDPDDFATIAGNDVSALLLDRHGLLWVGSETRGLTVYDPRTGRVERIRADRLDPLSLHDDMITDLAEDESGMLWVGTESVGVERVQPATVRLYRHHPLRDRTLASNVIWAFAERPDGLMWVGTRVGLNLLNPRTGHVTRFGAGSGEHPLSSKIVRALAIDFAGRLWAGVTGEGVFRIDQTTGDMIQYRHDPGQPGSLPDDRIYALFEDRSRRLWVGTENGLARLDPGRDEFVVFRHDPSRSTTLGANEVRRIYQDRSGVIWIGTRDGGLNRFEPREGTFTRFVHDPHDPASLSNDKVWSIHEDGSGSFWVGTLGGGLNRMDRVTGTFERFTMRDGLPDDVVYGILEDRTGHLWLSTNDGLSRFTPRTHEFRNLGTEHGLQGREFNSGAFVVSRDGRLWFGGLTGANALDPSIALGRSYEPRVVITNLTLDGVPVGPGARPNGRTVLEAPIAEATTITLAYGDGRVGFEFAALDYVRGGAAEYAYRLEGVDARWTHSGTSRTASYSQLRPGRYRFHVRGTNSDKTWSGKQALLDVIVEPAFWQTWWFYGLVGVALVAAFATWYVRQVHTVRERARVLEQQVKLRTKEIQGQVDVIGRQKQELEETLVELAAAKDKLVSAAHQAGMAEIATGVLHNIGNLQNSIATSCSVIRQRLQRSRSAGLARANDLLREHESRLAEFLTLDEHGRRLPGYYYTLESALERERVDLIAESERLAAKVAAVGEVIASQQEIAGAADLAEVVSLRHVVEDALILEASSLGHHDVKIIKRFSDVPRVTVQKSKLLQVLVNLLKNAKDALKGVDPDRRVITIGIDQVGAAIRVHVSDSGSGIAPDVMNRIFSYGFTTKPKGHGFGLHSCLNHATEMGGQLSVHSDGVGQGATFTLTLPLATADAAAA